MRALISSYSLFVFLSPETSNAADSTAELSISHAVVRDASSLEPPEWLVSLFHIGQLFAI